MKTAGGRHKMQIQGMIEADDVESFRIGTNTPKYLNRLQGHHWIMQ